MAGISDYNRYKDLDLDFIPHPVSGDVVQKVGADAVKRSVRNLIYMRIYEKPFQPHIHSTVRNLLFEPATPLITIQLKKSISEVLTRNEPRIKLIEVGVQGHEESYKITIRYGIKNQPEVETVLLNLKRLR